MRVGLEGRVTGRRLSGLGLTGLVLATGLLAVGPAAAQSSSPFPMASGQAAAAPSAANMKIATELLAANGEATAFDAIVPGIIEQAANSFVQANPDLIRDLREVAKSLVPEYENRRAEVSTILARAYATQFTEAELKELLAFYQSPVGVKLVARRQELLDEGLRGVQAWSAKFSREMEVRVREEMKKRGFTI